MRRRASLVGVVSLGLGFLAACGEEVRTSSELLRTMSNSGFECDSVDTATTTGEGESSSADGDATEVEVVQIRCESQQNPYQMVVWDDPGYTEEMKRSTCASFAKLDEGVGDDSVSSTLHMAWGSHWFAVLIESPLFTADDVANTLGGSAFSVEALCQSFGEGSGGSDEPANEDTGGTNE